MCHEILNLRSTLAEEAGTPKKVFPKAPIMEKYFNCFSKIKMDLRNLNSLLM